MEVKFYIRDPKTNPPLSIPSNIINNNTIIDADYLEFEFEMVTLEATNEYDNRYTSLKDISPPCELSRKESWREVPLKDPLVRQAAWAWAYLPLSKTEHQRNGFIGKLRDGFVGCFRNVLLLITGKLLPDQEFEIDDDDQQTYSNNIIPARSKMIGQ
ncbi:hypothetical protein DCAR_0623226 [Daucus carota subsp. sativus]|uniref:Uncharacterized protein n=1 Tax=Daucus carota subsp. sativus TaxID=79200 RepID=A0A164V520_DAUCS|nr:hypothetical protein DCAR_0623226 [Daucus carota subsp. sativus]